MSGVGNHRTHALPDLNPPPRARNAVGERLAKALLRSTNIQRLSTLGWALSFLRALRHAGLPPILHVSRNFHSGAKVESSTLLRSLSLEAYMFSNYDFRLATSAD
jgi:hypothetical protein